MLAVDDINPENVLALVKAQPMRFQDLAQSKSINSRRRRKVLEAIQTLQAQDMVRLIYLEGAQVYVTPDWSLSDERLQLMIDGRMKHCGSCMDWIGNFSTHYAPILAITKSMNRPDLPRFMHVRRWLWERKRGVKLPSAQSLKPTCGNDLCVNPDHLRPQHRTDAQKGRALTLVQRVNIAEGIRKSVGRITADQARAIRESDEPTAVLAKRYGVTRANVNHIKRGDTWREYVNNPFIQLAA